ncbi:hypothetical protein [Bosea sp. 2RAB26]|uniref:hypothetical protein n=1 Tax=Bosea sp. 2RAB26 TaxID=3237476 RepID=UPI003F8EA85F
MRLRILPRFPAQVQATAPVAVTQTAGTYLFTADYRPVGAEAAPALGTYAIVLQNQTTGAFVRTLLADLPTGSTDWTNIRNRPQKIDSLATLDTSLGAVEQIDANSFVKRTIGGGGPTSLVTYGDANLFYQPMSIRLSSIVSTGVATADIANDAVTFAKMQNIATSRLLGRTTAGSGDTEEISIGAGLTLSGGQLSSSAVASTGSIINSVTSAYTSNATVTGTIPIDNTIPQNTEGTEIQTVTITPSSALSKIRIRWNGQVSSAVLTTVVTAALFIDSGVNAVGAIGVYVNVANSLTFTGLVYEYTPGDTSSHTYRIRVGPNGGTCALNGSVGTPYFNGTSAAVLVAEEIKG